MHGALSPAALTTGGFFSRSPRASVLWAIADEFSFDSGREMAPIQRKAAAFTHLAGSACAAIF